MKITRQQQDSSPNKWEGWHVLTVAEAGFSMLDVYARHQHGLDIEIVRRFADRLNASNESGSLFPRAPISALPRRFFHDHATSDDPQILSDFRRHISEFLNANRLTIHAKRVLVDFRVSFQPVPEQYLSAVEDVFRSHGPDSGIEEVVIFT
ncbi:MAG: hypothetical protein N2689_16230 [Verrucomicrobiae bacterium]|nr:hypothetical protein [Verrucomicrobiae bacterium]